MITNLGLTFRPGASSLWISERQPRCDRRRCSARRPRRRLRSLTSIAPPPAPDSATARRRTRADAPLRAPALRPIPCAPTAMGAGERRGQRRRRDRRRHEHDHHTQHRVQDAPPADRRRGRAVPAPSPASSIWRPKVLPRGPRRPACRGRPGRRRARAPRRLGLRPGADVGQSATPGALRTGHRPGDVDAHLLGGRRRRARSGPGTSRSAGSSRPRSTAK